MPLYDYGCFNEDCKHEWEVQHMLADPGPSECPVCSHTVVKKLISAVRGKVELSGAELKAKVKEDVRQIKKDMNNSEKVLSNLVGEDKYQANVSSIERFRKG